MLRAAVFFTVACHGVVCFQIHTAKTARPQGRSYTQMSARADLPDLPAIDDSTFEEQVIRASNTSPVVVDFTAQWCGPCKVIEPMLKTLDAEGLKQPGDVKVVKAEPDQTQAFLKWLKGQGQQVAGLPTLVLFDKGRPLGRLAGRFNADNLREFVAQHVKGIVQPIRGNHLTYMQMQPIRVPVDEESPHSRWNAVANKNSHGY